MRVGALLVAEGEGQLGKLEGRNTVGVGCPFRAGRCTGPIPPGPDPQAMRRTLAICHCSSSPLSCHLPDRRCRRKSFSP